MREVEVRVDLPPANTRQIVPPVGWRFVATHADGRVLISKSLALTDAHVRAMFGEALAFAHANHGKFHSWMHAPNLKR